jgi:ATP-dependent RNA helicase DDX24/MAK5
MLRANPEIVVATPGRLWDLISSGHPYFENYKRLRYLVLDEADRMVERGHYEELDKLLEKLPDPLQPAFEREVGSRPETPWE